MASTPFSIAGVLQLPGDQGLPQDQIPLSMISTFTSENKQVLNLTGSGTMTLPMGTIDDEAGVKCLLIKVDLNASPGVQPVFVKINDETVGEELSPGGIKLSCNPTPSAGITALTLVWTTPNVVRVWALG